MIFLGIFTFQREEKAKALGGVGGPYDKWKDKNEPGEKPVKDWGTKSEYPFSLDSLKSHILANTTTPSIASLLVKGLLNPKEPEDNEGESRGGRRPHNATFCLKDVQVRKHRTKRFTTYPPIFEK